MSGPRVRKCVLIGFALLGLGAITTACTSERETATRPRAENLIMVSLDTLRADHVGYAGYERPTTPNLDQFAESAVVFENAIAQASSTRPSHQSLFQSRPASAAAGNHLALAEVLAQNGFRTAAFTGGGNISSKLGFARGFERYDERDTGLAGTLPLASSWLRKHRDQRFFLFLHTYDIHLPYDPPEPYASMFSDGNDSIVRGAETRDLLRKVRGLDGRPEGAFDLDEKDKDRVVALYDGGIRYTDSQLGHLFALADELDLYRDTVFVIFSDHGEEFWDHGSTIHSHSLYQELIHVPLVVRAPGLTPRRVSERIPLMDVAPTVLELLSVAKPGPFEGTSLSALMRGTQGGDRTILSEQRALKSWIAYPWKLVRSADPDAVELYDLSKDPLEKTNLADAHPDIVDRFERNLDARLAGTRHDAVPELDPAVIDPEHLERLRALGYVE